MLLLAACSHEDSIQSENALTATDSLSFEIVHVFGPAASALPIGSVAELSPIQGDLTPLLIAPSSAGVDSLGQVFVLDPRARRIYAYQPDGNPIGAMGALGEGPGEMAQPISFSLASNGELTVSDIQLRRVTVYDPAGGVVSTTPVTRNGITALLSGSQITLLTDFGPSSKDALIRYSLSGDVVQEFGELTDRDKEFARGGHFGWLSAVPNSSRILLFSGAPGRWTPYDSTGRSLGRRGLELFPGAGFAQLEQDDGFPLSYTTAGTVTAGIIGNQGTVFITYFTDLSYGKQLPARHDYRWGVALFDTTGTLLAKGSLPAAWGRLSSASAGPNGTLLLTLSEPEPHVVAVRMHRTPVGRTIK